MQRLDNTLLSCGGMECAYKELVIFLSPNGADLVACQPSSIAPLALHFVLGTGWWKALRFKCSYKTGKRRGEVQERGRSSQRERERARENIGQQQEACPVKIFTCSLCKCCCRRMAVTCVPCTGRWTRWVFVCECVYEYVCLHRLASSSLYDQTKLSRAELFYISLTKTSNSHHDGQTGVDFGSWGLTTTAWTVSSYLNQYS